MNRIFSFFLVFFLAMVLVAPAVVAGPREDFEYLQTMPRLLPEGEEATDFGGASVQSERSFLAESLTIQEIPLSAEVTGTLEEATQGRAVTILFGDDPADMTKVEQMLRNVRKEGYFPVLWHATGGNAGLDDAFQVRQQLINLNQEPGGVSAIHLMGTGIPVPLMGWVETDGAYREWPFTNLYGEFTGTFITNGNVISAWEDSDPAGHLIEADVSLIATDKSPAYPLTPRQIADRFLDKFNAVWSLDISSFPVSIIGDDDFSSIIPDWGEYMEEFFPGRVIAYQDNASGDLVTRAKLLEVLKENWFATAMFHGNVDFHSVYRSNKSINESVSSREYAGMNLNNKILKLDVCTAGNWAFNGWTDGGYLAGVFANGPNTVSVITTSRVGVVFPHEFLFEEVKAGANLGQALRKAFNRMMIAYQKADGPEKGYRSAMQNFGGFYINGHHAVRLVPVSPPPPPPPLKETIEVEIVDAHTGNKLLYNGIVPVKVGEDNLTINVSAGTGSLSGNFTDVSVFLAAFDPQPVPSGYEVVSKEDSCGHNLLDGGVCRITIRCQKIEEPPPVTSINYSVKECVISVKKDKRGYASINGKFKGKYTGVGKEKKSPLVRIDVEIIRAGELPILVQQKFYSLPTKWKTFPIRQKVQYAILPGDIFVVHVDPEGIDESSEEDNMCRTW